MEEQAKKASLLEGMSRRKFLRLGLGGAAVSSLLLSGCNQGKFLKHIYSVLDIKEEENLGKESWYATICQECHGGCGLLVQVLDGRAKKVEGNPLYPVNYGKTCARAQAALQGLYNPDRYRRPKKRRIADKKLLNTSWDDALEELTQKLAQLIDANRTNELLFLTPPLRGHMYWLTKQFMQTYGSPHLYRYQLFDDSPLEQVYRQTLDSPRLPKYDIENADYILSFGTQFLESWFSPVHFARAYGRFRQGDPKEERDYEKQRGYFIQIEPRLSLTGSSADEWIPISPGTDGLLAVAIAKSLLEDQKVDYLSQEERTRWLDSLNSILNQKANPELDVDSKKTKQLAGDLASAKRPIVLGGSTASGSTNGYFNLVAINALNYLLGNKGGLGGLLANPDSPLAALERFQKGIGDGTKIQERTDGSGYSALEKLGDQILTGKTSIKIALIYGVDPLHTLPKKSRFRQALEKIPYVVCFSSFPDETASKLANLILSAHTPLESWGDDVPLAAPGGTVYGLGQPVVTPYYDTKHPGDVLLELARTLGGRLKEELPWWDFQAMLQNSLEELYSTHLNSSGEISFSSFKDQLISLGGWYESAIKGAWPQPPKSQTKKDEKEFALEELQFPTPEFEGDSQDYPFILLPYLSTSFNDGQGANLPWLQEMGDPMTTVAWGSWVELNPKTAKKLGIKEGDRLRVQSPHGTVKLPAYIYPGILPDVVAMPVGQGHGAYGRYAKGRGANPIEILAPQVQESTGSLAWLATRVSVKKMRGKSLLVKYEHTSDQGELEIIQVVGKEEDHSKESEHSLHFEKPKEKEFTDEGVVFPEEGKPYRWGMVIDLDRCIGCKTCKISCAAENNLPIVGEKEVAKGGAMNWIDVQRYWEGAYPDIKARFIPIPCQQCGNAPCEPVCPVYATYQNDDGLNVQVYARCVGTRYCGNNCPFNARYFNWFNPSWPKPLHEQLNPNITIRSKGVIEKCSFCIHRIKKAKRQAKDENRRVREGDIQPACVQSCPTEAMVFGDINDPSTKVYKLTKSKRKYRLFEDLGVEPAVTYLKAVHGKRGKTKS